ncbi:MAG: polysaccharide pyruvyl transferase family protein [Sedimentisphaerales bacterium]|nr:polysaccharide pyruvyl transferase family protein [Sedimentisphaerales bacterium]
MIPKGIEWIRNHIIDNEGVAVSSRRRIAYPEVTGYLIPTLQACGEHELARNFARWLLGAQQQDGAFTAPGTADRYAFDTGQVIRGWVSLLDRLPKLERSLRRACDWLIGTADATTGRLRVPRSKSAWSLGPRGEISEGIHLYALAPLEQAGHALNEPSYIQFVRRSLDYYLKKVRLTDFRQPNALTHFYAYIQEALLELGCEQEARIGMASVAAFQKANGAVPAYNDVDWICAPGLAQLAQVWYRLGEIDRAEAAMKALSALQNPSGGFFGSYGVGAAYFEDAEIAWAVKYAIEAAQQQIRSHFDQTVDIYQATIPETDGRVQAVIRHLGDLNGKRVLDAGCGKGRYASMLKRHYPTAEITAMDISAAMLSHVPPGIRTVLHGILDMPFAEGCFDAVLCIEALEHVVQVKEAVRELTRVLAPGGTLVIIDKNEERLGALAMPNWERWFDQEELLSLLRDNGLQSQVHFVGYKNRPADDGLFLCWAGHKTHAASVDRPRDNTVSLPSAKKSVGSVLTPGSRDGCVVGAVDIPAASIAQVVADGLCVGCGACKGVCPYDDVIHHEIVGGIFAPVVDASACRNCGRCRQVCPGLRAIPPAHEAADEGGYDPHVGPYLSFWEGYATDENVRRDAASGGVVTAILCSLLQRGQLDYVVCAGFSEDSSLKTAVSIVDNVEDLEQAKGSKYLPVPIAEAIRFIGQTDKRFAVVGLPCYLQAFRAAEHLQSEIVDRVKLYVGLFCQNVSNYTGLQFLLKMAGISPHEIKRFSFRGNGWPGGMTIELISGETKYIPLQKYWPHLQFFHPRRCLVCPDALAEHADIAVGDAWLPEYRGGDPGMSVVVARTRRGQDLLADVVTAKDIAVTRSSLERVKQSQPWLLRHKKDLLPARRDVLGKLGVRLPDCTYPEVTRVDSSSTEETWTFLQKASKACELAREAAGDKTQDTISKVLIVNQCGMWNLGDEALYQSTYELLRESFPYAEIATATHTYGSDKASIGTPLVEQVLVDKALVDRFNGRRIELAKRGEYLADAIALQECFREERMRRLVEAYVSADLIVSRGGDNFTEDYGYPGGFINALQLGIWLKKKVVILGESIGPFRSPKLREEIKTVLSQLSAVIVREEISFRYLTEEIGLSPSQVRLFPDMAFFLRRDRPALLGELREALGVDAGTRYVALFPSSLVHRWLPFGKNRDDRQEAVTRFHIALCRHLTEEMGYHVVLLPHVFKDGKSDRLEAEKIKRALVADDRVHLVEKDYHFWDYRAFIEAHCEFVLSGRMHPCISSLSAGKPAINLVYSHKSEGIVGKLFDCGKLLVDIRQVAGEAQLMEACRRAVREVQANYQAYTEKIRTVYTTLYAQKPTLRKFLVGLATGRCERVREVTLPQDGNALAETERFVGQHLEVPAPRAATERRPEVRKRILYYGAGWPTNVGNAFIDMGAMAALQIAFPDATVGFASEMPRWFFGNYKRYHGEMERNASSFRMDRALDLAALVHCDLVAFAGMAMCEEFVTVNGPTLLKLRQRGIPVILLGTGGYRYDARERSIFAQFLQQLEPAGFIARDARSFDAYKDVVGQACQGIDSAFFLPEAFEPFPLDLPPYVVANFDTTAEPVLPVHGRLLLRTHHSCWSVPDAHFEQDNTLISDIPQDYLTLYANADEVHTDRVHATVATLSYGGRAQFYHPTPRGSLFSVLGLDDIKKRPVRLDMDLLQRRKLHQIEALKNIAGFALDAGVSSDGKHRVMEFRADSRSTKCTACTAATPTR